MSPAASQRPGLDRASLERSYAEHVARLAAAYERALADTGFDAVLLHAGVAKSRSQFDDQYWSLRVTPHFAHWLPLAVANCAVLVQPGRRPTLLHNTERGFWEGIPEPETDHFWGAFDVVTLADPSQAAARVKDLVPAGRRLALVAEDGVPAEAWGVTPEAKNPKTLVEALDALRVEKSAYEVLCLAEANRRASLGHARLRDAFFGGDLSELELHLLYLSATLQDDGETPYKNIVALGEHASVLHHIHYSRAARSTPAQSFLLDAGATCQGYHSDVTRTFIKGKTAEAQAFGELLARLDGLQKEMCGRVRVGLPYERLHNESHELLAPVLRDLGLVKASDDELIAGGATRKFFPHGLGHALGLQTHDVGCGLQKPAANNPFLRNTSTVEAGQCFTIEPGCYFIDSLLDELRATPLGARVDWALVERLKPFGGIRVEDDLLVLPDGVRNFTREVIPA